jgi:hypothetical protein
MTEIGKRRSGSSGGRWSLIRTMPLATSGTGSTWRTWVRPKLPLPNLDVPANSIRFSLTLNAALGRTLRGDRHFDEAIEQCSKRLELEPNFAQAYWWQHLPDILHWFKRGSDDGPSLYN